MNQSFRWWYLCALGLLTMHALAALTSPLLLGIFEGQADIGTILHAGSADYDPAHQTYTLSGSGANMWGREDDFYFVWTKVSGDVSLTADIAFIGNTGNPHRKAVLMMRQSLDGNSPGVDVALHGNGMTALQFRDAAGSITHDVEANVSGPQTVRIEKRGDYFYAYLSGKDGKLQAAGASTKLALTGSFYLGIGVCSHDKDVVEQAVFSNVKMVSLPPPTGQQVLYSALETISVSSGDRRVVYVAPAHFEAPNWSRDGSFFLFNGDGKLHRLGLTETEPRSINTDPEAACNNDHGISPDAQSMAISCQPGSTSATSSGSAVYLVPLGGGTPRQLTQRSPSYWHGWSPDGKTLAFTGQRDGDFDIYTIPVTGGQETRLTTAKGLDDGPEYTPDGEHIYFNSERSGSMQIWRMKADGSEQEQVLSDQTNDWFPHFSPDGKWMVFLSYDRGVSGHPAQKDVALNLMSMSDKSVHLLTRLFGGQGTINVPSWSPDSKKLAFVSYELLPVPGN